MQEPVVKFGVTIPSWAARRLEVLAALKNKPRATLAADLILDYIHRSFEEPEKERLDRQLEAIASDQGITKEDLIKSWLSQASRKD